MINTSTKQILIIGGGAAGFFTAINIAEKHPDYQVTILEKTNKVLSKVKISGGGRCNVTNGRSSPSSLTPFYPRGNKKLHPVFKQFTTTDMIRWLEERGVETRTEEDLRVFPATNSSQTIIDCFTKQMKQLKIELIQGCSLLELLHQQDQWQVLTNQGTFKAHKVVCCTGSSPSVWKILKNLKLKITPPVPSLFTFNINDTRIKELMGVSFPEVNVRIINSKLQESGPLLITHWGLSGPAVLKLSAWGARELSACDYSFKIMVNYLGKTSADLAHKTLQDLKSEHPKRKVINYPLNDLPKRFWEQMCRICNIADDETFAELSKKKANKLMEELTQGVYSVTGKSTFKDEFVTSGGIALSEVDLKTFECKNIPNLYMAGEVLDIDALTGGFNFQACWSAGWVISENIKGRL